MSIDLLQMATFGVAGNFTGHLEQAGEAKDFTSVKTAEVNAPKALFPTYIPGNGNITPSFLRIFPFSSDKILFPKGEQKLQLEPECAIICNVQWKDNKVLSVTPFLFGASNDCSIRKEGAKKISLKKNWGPCSKGLSSNLLPVDSFNAQGLINSYRIASFMVRDNDVFLYGEDSAIRDYSYIYDKLLAWITDKLNNQKDEGPAENLSSYLLESGKVQQIMVSIGATRYTDFGEHNFLKNGDYSVVVLYPENKYSLNEITQMVKEKNFKENDISFLSQQVIL